MKVKKTPRKTSKPFRKGQLNRLVDDLIHPFFEENKNLIWIDGILHGLVEQNPRLTMEKFVKYSVPQLMKTRARYTQQTCEADRNSNYVGCDVGAFEPLSDCEYPLNLQGLIRVRCL
jgi:hypothetical protein